MTNLSSSTAKSKINITNSILKVHQPRLRPKLHSDGRSGERGPENNRGGEETNKRGRAAPPQLRLRVFRGSFLFVRARNQVPRNKKEEAQDGRRS